MTEGDIVTCIDNKRLIGNLTISKRYVVLSISNSISRNGTHIKILDDAKLDRWYMMKRFISKEEHREQQINNILN